MPESLNFYDVENKFISFHILLSKNRGQSHSVTDLYHDHHALLIFDSRESDSRYSCNEFLIIFFNILAMLVIGLNDSAPHI